MLHNVEEWQTIVSKTIPSGKSNGKLSPTKAKGSIQSSFSNLNTVPWAPQEAVVWSSRQLNFSLPALSASGFLLEPTCGMGATIDHMALTARRSCKCTSQYICEVDKCWPLLSLGLMSVSHVRWLSQAKLLCTLGGSVPQSIPSLPLARPLWCICLASPDSTLNQVPEGVGGLYPHIQLSH